MPNCESTTCKRNPSCGCPSCRLHLDDCNACCRCIPTTICVSMLVEARETCHVELDWNEQEENFTGSIACRGTTYDLLFYFERDSESGTCYFVLRSDEGGLPEGYEHRWEIGEEIKCDDLDASVDLEYDQTLLVEAVEKHTPVDCSGCKCLCDCVCLDIVWPADATQPWGTRCRGKLCWDEYQDAWIGAITCNNPYDSEFSYDAKVEWRRRGEFCDQFPYEECDECDPSCIPVLQIPEIGIVDAAAVRMTPCEERNVDYQWEVTTNDGHVVTVIMRCARCGEICARIACCPWDKLPDTLYLTDQGLLCNATGIWPLYYAGMDPGVIHWWEGPVKVRCRTGKPFDDACDFPHDADPFHIPGPEYNFVWVRVGCVDAIMPDGQSGSSIWIAQRGCHLDDTWFINIDIVHLDCDPFLAEVSYSDMRQCNQAGSTQNCDMKFWLTW